MSLIKLFLLGLSGYLFVGLYDVSIITGRGHWKHIFSVGFVLTGIPYIYLLLTVDSPHQLPITLLLLILIGLFFVALIYSVFIELMLFAPGRHTVYRGGTYSFSRHPGFIWYTVINILVALYVQSAPVTVLCVVFVVCNLALIIIEDRHLFPRMFVDYDQYKQQTPCILSLRKKL
jgi:protein-S-isoprenylcysteine O-methyltransferase Ste14